MQWVVVPRPLMLGAGQKESRRTCRDWGENHVGTISEERDLRLPARFRPECGGHDRASAASTAARHPRLTACRPAGAAFLPQRPIPPPSGRRVSRASPARGLVRSAGALAAVALLALCGGLALPATAQAEVLVSNIGKTTTGSGSLFDELGQRFTTGRSDASFPLTSIDVKFTTAPSSMETLTATVRRADANDNPGDVHATLTPPSAIVRGNNTFMALAGTTLAAGTKYFVVIKTEDVTLGDAVLSATNSSGEDGVTGWTIQNSQRFYQSDTWHSVSGNPLQIRVNGTVPPQTPPTLKTGIQVRPDGARIYMTFSEGVSDMVPPTSAYTVTAGGSPVTVGSAPRVASDSIELRGLSPLIGDDETVTLAYRDPTTGNDINAIQDTNGNDASSFSNVSVDNHSEVTLPKLNAAAVPADGATVVLTFSADLDFPTAFSSVIRGAFTVTVDGTESQTTDFAVSGATATLTMSDPIVENLAVIVSYDRSDAGSEAIGSTSNKLVANFTTGENSVAAVVNNSEADTSPPTLSSAVVGLTGDRIALDFSENLDTSAGARPPARSAFSVSADGASIVVGSVVLTSITPDRIQLLSLDPLIYQGQTVTVTYTDPTSGDDAVAIQDSDGNAAASFTTGEDGVPAVTNDSTAVAAPGAPTALTATAFGATAIDLAWTAPGNDGGSAITGYKIEVSTDGSTGSWSDRVADTESTNTDYRHSGLSGGDTRHYRVSAINAEGTSPASAPDSATTGTAAHHAVPAPIHGTVVWSATMTVEALTNTTFIGYRSSKDDIPFGALTPTTFDRGDGTTVTVDALYYWERLSDLQVFFDTGLGTGRFNLHLGTVTEEIDDPGDDDTMSLDISDPGWSHGDTVDVRLVRATAPGTPTGLTATASGTQIDLAWTAPASDGGRAVTGYRIEVSEDGSAGSWSDRVADTDTADTSYSHTGLAVGDTRHYRVSAINAAGTSEASGTADATTIDPPTPSSVTVAFGGDTFVIRYSEDLHQVPLIVPTAIVSAFTLTVDGVERQINNMVANSADRMGATLASIIYQGQTVVVSYDKSAAGGEALADSDGDEVASFTTGEDGVPAVVNNSTQVAGPPAPTNFMATAGGLQVALTWDAPASGSGVTRHEYRFKTDGGYPTMWEQIDDSAPGGANEASFTVTGLTGGTAHTFQLRAVSAAGNSTAAEDGPVTPSAILTPPTIDEVAVTSTPLLTSSGGSTPDTYGRGETIEVSVTFSEAVTATSGTDFVLSVAGRKRAPLMRGSGTATLVFGYTVLAADEDDNGIWIGDQSRTLVGNRNGTPQTGTITSETTDVAADLTHAALGQQSGHKVDGSLAPSGTNTAPVFADGRVTRTVPENSEADTNVGAPIPAAMDTNGDTLTYTMEGEDAVSFTFVASTRQITTKAGVDYDFEATKNSYAVTVRASDGTASDTIAVRIDLTNVDDAPDAPTSLRYTPGNGQVTLRWTTPADNGGATITDYEYKQDDAGTWKTTGGTTTRYTVTGLTNGTRYTFWVRAVNSIGESRASEPIFATPSEVTVPPDSDPDPVGPPSPPRDLTATAGDQAVELSWRRPAEDGGARIVRYEYRQQEGDGPFGAWQIIGEDPPPTAHQVTGLTNGTSYTFQVRAVNQAGPGPAVRTTATPIGNTPPVFAPPRRASSPRPLATPRRARQWRSATRLPRPTPTATRCTTAWRGRTRKPSPSARAPASSGRRPAGATTMRRRRAIR